MEKSLKRKLNMKNDNWIFFVSKRFARVDRKGRSKVTSILASLGIGFGVCALIVTLSVMNGFQMSFIDTIMEVSSYHVRVNQKKLVDENTRIDNSLFDFIKWCDSEKSVLSCTPFYEAQGLLVGSVTRQANAVIRAVPSDVLNKDAGMKKELEIISGSFDLKENSSGVPIVLGSSLARSLSCYVGSTLNILALSGSSDTSLFSDSRKFVVKGIFHSGYADLNSTYAFIDIDNALEYFGKSADCIYGIKLSNPNKDSEIISKISRDFPMLKAESWRSFNRTFFGALRIEKNMLFLLVLLIFLVVGINIYNSLRKMVFQRQEEIAVLSSLGARKNQVQNVFIIQGFLTGFKGSFFGLLSGLFICAQMKNVFNLLSKIQFYFEYFFAMLINPSSGYLVKENPMFAVYGSIPARIIPSEIIFVFAFGILSSLLASWIASRNVLKFTVSEVLRNE